MTLVVSSKQVNSSFARPALQRVRLMLAFVMRPLDLENSVARRDDVGDESAFVRLLEVEIPLFGALLDEPRKALLPASV
jgi:hypothetical protein